MIETTDYWLIDNKIIFKPKFNSSLGVYDHILSQCNELVFSNYDDVLICVETLNKYTNKYHKNFKTSKFYQKVQLPTNLTSLTFGYDFNQTVNLPQNLSQFKLANKKQQDEILLLFLSPKNYFLNILLILYHKLINQLPTFSTEAINGFGFG